MDPTDLSASKAVSTLINPFTINLQLQVLIYQIRRAQNRESQKNFRARRAVRVHSLEAEVYRMQEVYQALEQASANKSQEIKMLNTYIEQLTTEIESSKSFLRLSDEEQAVLQSFECFNLNPDDMALPETSKHYSFGKFSLF